MAEQALHAYTRARRAAHRMGLRRTTGLMLYQHTLKLVGRARDYLYISYGGDTGQCLTAKPQRRQRLQVVNVPELAGREALQRQRSLLGMHAAAVISHLDEPPSPIDQLDIDTRAASIEGIVDEFLDDRGGALDDFSSRNAAGRDRIELLNTPRHAGTSPFPSSVRACCCR